jgi:hypothetical protein
MDINTEGVVFYFTNEVIHKVLDKEASQNQDDRHIHKINENVFLNPGLDPKQQETTKLKELDYSVQENKTTKWRLRR